MDGEQQERERRKKLEHRERLASDPDYRRRFMLRCVSGGFSRNAKAPVTVSKMSWDK